MWLRRASLLACLLPPAAWLLVLLGARVPGAAVQAAVALALATGLGWSAWALFGPGRSARRGVLAGLLLLAALVRGAGLDYGLAERYNEDEGVYTRRAAEINSGRPFPDTFRYPHLVFYAQAAATWLGAQMPGAVLRVTGLLWGVSEWPLANRLLTRLVVWAASVATVVPVFELGALVAGTGGGVLGSLLLIFNPLFNEGSHYNTCDIPAAFLAAVTLLLAARLAERESLRGYLLGGAASGLAAAAKYPAGFTALALAAAWGRGRLRSRRFSWSLVWAGAASLGCFLLANPAILVHPATAFGKRSGILVGVTDYQTGGWVGVLAEHSLLHYLGSLVRGFGWPAVLLGLGGLAALAPDRRRSVAWMIVYPAAFLASLGSARIVVDRSLYPVLPLLAAVLGAGAWRLTGAGALRRGRPALAAGVGVAVLAMPVLETVAQDVRMSVPETRELARTWLLENLPPGCLVAREEYTPQLPARDFVIWNLSRFVVSVPMERLRHPDTDFLLVSSFSYGRFFDGMTSGPKVDRARATYEEIFRSWPLVRSFVPSRWRGGPELRLYRVDPPAPEYLRERSFRAADLFVCSARMHEGKPGRAHYLSPGQWTMVKGRFEAGRYAIRLEGSIVPGGEGALRDLSNREVARVGFAEEPRARFELKARGRYFVYLWLPLGTRLEGVRIEPAGEPEWPRD